MKDFDYYIKCYLIYTGSSLIEFDIVSFIDSCSDLSDKFLLRVIDNIKKNKYKLDLFSYDKIIDSILSKKNISRTAMLNCFDLFFRFISIIDVFCEFENGIEDNGYICKLNRLKIKYMDMFTIDRLDNLLGYSGLCDLYRIYMRYGKLDIVKKYVLDKQELLLSRDTNDKDISDIYGEFISYIINSSCIDFNLELFEFINLKYLKEFFRVFDKYRDNNDVNKIFNVYTLFLLYFIEYKSFVFSKCFEFVSSCSNLSYSNILHLISLYELYLSQDFNSSILLLDGFVNALVNNGNISVSEFMDCISDLDDRFNLRDIFNSIDISINDNLDDYSVLATRKREAFYNYIEGKRVRNHKSISRVKKISINKAV